MATPRKGSNLQISLFLISFVVFVPALKAHIAEFDEYWQLRLLEAKNNTVNDYHPNPEEVTNDFNLKVHRLFNVYLSVWFIFLDRMRKETDFMSCLFPFYWED